MLSKRYIFKSDGFRDSYIHSSIDHQTYLSSLENIKKEELVSAAFDLKQREMEEEIFGFESQQMSKANQEISNRKKNTEALLQIEKEKTKQLEETRKLKEEEKKVQPQTLEEKLLKARTDFYEKETPEILYRYKNDARKHRNKHNRIQFSIIAGSALASGITSATIFTNATDLSMILKIVAAFFSLMVAIASGSMAYFKYKERSNGTQKAADTIEDDRNALKLGTGVYKGISTKDALSIFAERTNNTISEHKKQQLLLDQPPDAKPSQTTQ